MYAVVGPTSPPRAKPCTRRKNRRITGAAGPIIAYEGVRASPTIANPINVKEKIIAGLRPMRSPMPPITIAPIGRVRNPAPKVASVASSAAEELPDGKKVREM